MQWNDRNMYVRFPFTQSNVNETFKISSVRTTNMFSKWNRERNKNGCHYLSINCQKQSGRQKTKPKWCLFQLYWYETWKSDWQATPIFSSGNSTGKLHLTLFIQFSMSALCFQILSVSKPWEWEKMFYFLEETF